MAETPKYLAIGRIVSAFGIRGEVKVEIHTDDPSRFGQLRRVFVGKGGEPRPVAVLGARLHINDATANTVSPIWNVRRLPKRSPVAPESSSNDASASV